MSLVSVIVPVFQVEMYLRKCLDSILKQSYEQLEIILVDVGSTDVSGLICDEYAKNDERIQVIHQRNKGLSGARNAGIQKATGEYLVLVDSDDWIDVDYIKKMMKCAKEQDCSLVICNYRKVSTDDEQIEKNDNSTSLTLGRNDLLLSMYEPYAVAKGFSPTAITVAWNKLYKTSLWESLVFPEGRIHEDEATTYLILDKVEKACFLMEPLYFYRQTPGSIMNLKFSLKRLDWMLALEERIQYFKDAKNDLLVLESMKAYADTSINFYFELKKTAYSSEMHKLKTQVRAVLIKHRKYGTLPLRTKFGYCLFLLNASLFNFLNGGYGHGTKS